MRSYRSNVKPRDQPGWKKKETKRAKKKRLYKEMIAKRKKRAVDNSDVYQKFLQ